MPSHTHVNVIGIPEGVTEANQRLWYMFHPHKNVTMKMEVPWTCHSHIIGKGGKTIQPVVKRTGVTIHFPDGNKNSDVSKSNQVSINSRGQEISGLEEARIAVRNLTPLIFSFSLPATAEFISYIHSSYLVSHVQSLYNVQAEIQLFNDETLLGSVKGTECDATMVKNATLCLLKGLCGNIANQITVQVSLDISPQHHPFVLGRNNEVVKRIMQKTATKIVFPDWNDQLLPPLKRSTVTICGAIENTYQALQSLIGCCPLVLMFDVLPENTIDQFELSQIMQTLNIIIVLKVKKIGEKRFAIIKGAERNAANIYEGWRLITNNQKVAPQVNIPSTYGIVPHFPSSLLCNGSSGLNLDQNILNLQSNVEPTMNELLGVTLENKTPQSNCSCEFNDDSSLPLGGSSEPSYTSSDQTDIFEDIEPLLQLVPDRRAPGCEKKQGFVSDYYIKKLLAAKVMEQPVSAEPRVTTSVWSGYGFSKSQPAGLLNQLKKSEASYDSGWSTWCRGSLGSSSTINEGSSPDLRNHTYEVREDSFVGKADAYSKALSNYLDGLSLSHTPNLNKCTFNDVNSILLTLQLEQYKEYFNLMDINIDKFCKLTDQDLKDLGVTTFGHRKKLLMAVKNLALKKTELSY